MAWCCQLLRRVLLHWFLIEHAQGVVSSVILDAIKLSVNINHH